MIPPHLFYQIYLSFLEPCLGARRAKLSLQYASKIKSLPKHPAHNAVFDNKYMKLFDARPNAIRTFSLRIKQCLTASNIELSCNHFRCRFRSIVNFSLISCNHFRCRFRSVVNFNLISCNHFRCRFRSVVNFSLVSCNHFRCRFRSVVNLSLVFHLDVI